MCIFFWLILDGVVLLGILRLLQGDEAPELFNTMLMAAGMSVINFVCMLAGLLGLIPIVIVNGLILMYFCHLTIKPALIALGLFMAYKISLSLVLHFMVSSA